MPKVLTDRTIKSLKPAARGARYEVRDLLVPGLVVRVTARGTRSFMLQARFGTHRATRRFLGVYPEMSLEQAREKARGWRLQVRQGVDPADAEEQARREAERRQANNFAAVAEAFIAHCRRQGQRKAHEVARDLRTEFVKRWGVRPIVSITSADVREVIEAKIDEGHPAQARNLLGTVRRLFSWAIGMDAYGLDKSPCDRLRPRDLIGAKKARDRILSDRELKAFWKATEALGLPYGPLFRLLALTLQRKSEVAEAVRDEIDFGRALWIIPPERMKSDAAHLVPLPSLAIEIFASLPEQPKGRHLFTTTFGAKPVNGFSKAKTCLDELMLTELRRMADEEGIPPAAVKMAPWVIHDIRRTGRTHLSALPIADMVRELVIAHAKPGLHKVYDLHAYLEEKRQALSLWEQRLLGIVEPRVSGR